MLHAAMSLLDSDCNPLVSASASCNWAGMDTPCMTASMLQYPNSACSGIQGQAGWGTVP